MGGCDAVGSASLGHRALSAVGSGVDPGVAVEVGVDHREVGGQGAGAEPQLAVEAGQRRVTPEPEVVGGLGPQPDERDGLTAAGPSGRGHHHPVPRGGGDEPDAGRPVGLAVLAAHRVGVRTVVLPSRNEKNLLEDVPREIREAMKEADIERLVAALTEVIER